MVKSRRAIIICLVIECHGLYQFRDLFGDGSDKRTPNGYYLRHSLKNRRIDDIQWGRVKGVDYVGIYVIIEDYLNCWDILDGINRRTTLPMALELAFTRSVHMTLAWEEIGKILTIHEGDEGARKDSRHSYQ